MSVTNCKLTRHYISGDFSLHPTYKNCETQQRNQKQMMRMERTSIRRVLENTKIRKHLEPLNINLPDPTFPSETVMNLTRDQWKTKYMCVSEEWKTGTITCSDYFLPDFATSEVMIENIAPDKIAGNWFVYNNLCIQTNFQQFLIVFNNF